MSGPVLVVGASGFIGRHVADSLARRGMRVIAATRHPCNFSDPAIENAVGTFETPMAFASLVERSDVVVHAASSSSPASTFGASLGELDTNLRSLLALLTALQDRPGRRLVYLSSAGTLYGDCNERVDEDHPLRPRSYHGAAKAAAEQFIHAWADQYDAIATILRPSNIYGPGQVPRSGFGVIPAAFEAATQGHAFTVYGDGGSIRDYLYIDDLVDACLRAVARPRGGLSVYNVSHGEGVRLADLLDAIDRTTGLPLRRRHEPGRRVDIRHIVPANDRARTALAWEPSVGLEEGLRRAWTWFSTRA